VGQAHAAVHTFNDSLRNQPGKHSFDGYTIVVARVHCEHGMEVEQRDRRLRLQPT
jgi:hypothetical protein